MDAERAISLVVDWIRSQGIDYPIEGLEADRFDVGWSVYAPVDIDESDPMAFLELPVGRSLFLIGDSGRIQEVSSSAYPPRALAEFTAAELELEGAVDGLDESGFMSESEFMAEFQREFNRAESGGPPAISGFTVVDTPPDAEAAGEASRLIGPIVQQLAQLGPSGWERFSAEFALTVSTEIAQLRFWMGGGSGLVPVPKPIADLVRRQREVAARMPAGPWWRLLLTVTNRGQTTVDYDYGDEPFPDDQLMPPEYYRNDLASYPRHHVPVWLAGYVAGPAAQGRDPGQAAVAAAADAAAGRAAVVTDALPPLPEVWARWAVLSATHAGIRAEPGPQIFPGHAWYEDLHRSGSVLFLLPGGRAVLSGGEWGSELLEAAYNHGEPLPDLYTGAPAWVTDDVLNTRNRNGLLTFCLWWAGGRWHRGATDTEDELDAALPHLRTHDGTIRAMTGLLGAGAAGQCEALLTAATQHSATADQVAALFAGRSDADAYTAVNQLDLAGLLAGVR
ncbi:hypothetical protein GCM10023322_79600 [Rugosimonospora acidiphila]|uniref:SUKH-4 immunity protein of toxin-antitoxin system n=1 Tax=Rugosimonospora acidiphila TaxID=556531 RepID=A0ABP9SQJ2_9ACTN